MSVVEFEEAPELADEIGDQSEEKTLPEEFKQLDIEATIPMLAEQAEQKRQEVRDKYALMQTEIDATKQRNNKNIKH